jgi:hypothetical protein
MSESDWASFEEILRGDTTVYYFEPLPVGRYLTVLDEAPKFTQVGAKATNCVDFNLTPLEAIKVNREQLAKVLNGQDLSDRRIRHRMFITAKAKYRPFRFLHQDLGIPATTLREMIPQALGKRVYVELEHRQYGDRVYEDVKRTAKVSVERSQEEAV